MQVNLNNEFHFSDLLKRAHVPNKYILSMKTLTRIHVLVATSIHEIFLYFFTLRYDEEGV